MISNSIILFTFISWNFSIKNFPSFGFGSWICIFSRSDSDIKHFQIQKVVSSVFPKQEREKRNTLALVVIKAKSQVQAEKQ